MDVRLLLSKLIMLIYRTRQLGMLSYDPLINMTIDELKISDKDDGFLNAGMTKKLLDYVMELVSQHDEINLDNLVMTMEVMLENDPKLLKTITRSLSKELEENEIKKVIGSLSSEISQYRRYQEVRKIISKLSYNVNLGKSSISDTFKEIREAMGAVEPLTVSGDHEQDPGIVNEIFFNDKDKLKDVIESVRERVSNTGVYRTGWQSLNRMTQGGIRPGESIGLGALQHNYKTSMSQTIFTHIVTLNKPIMRKEDEGKKPLAIYMYLEDPVENGIQFIYQLLKADSGQFVSARDIEKGDPAEIRDFIIKEMEKNGFSVVLLKVDPSEWGYTDLFNYILKLEAAGYTIRVAFIDYLLMLQTTGCNSGGHGVDKRDLLRRVSNFFRARMTAFFTPVQLSSEAVNLLRNGVTDVRFVKEIAGKNYTADSRQISQEFDLELYCHIARAHGKAYLSVGRGKHRIPTNVEKEEDKFFLMPFPGPHSPILSDINGDDTGILSIPRGGTMSGGGGDDFLDDVLG